MADNIVVSYQSNLDAIIAQLKEVRQLNSLLTKQVDELGKKQTDNTQKQAGLIGNLRQRLAELQKARDASFDPSKIDRFNKILESGNARLSQLTGKFKEVPTQVDTLGNVFGKLGAQIAAAFSVGAIIAFGKASFDAFTQAEKTAKVLQTAVGVNGGLQKDFDALIKQSKELEKISIFSDDDIQNAQTMALQFGLTTKQVQQLIPVVTNFASATGQSLSGALDRVLAGIRGQGRALKDYQIEVSATGTKAENLRIITDQLNKSFAGQAEIVGNTTFGAVEKLKNQFNNFQEGIGDFIADVGSATTAIINWIGRGFKPLDDQLDSTAGKLDRVGQQIAAALPRALLQQQIDQFKALGQAVPQQLIDDLKDLNLDEFNQEIADLNEQELIKKLKDIQAETLKLFKPGDLTIQERVDILNQEIEARKKSNKLLDDQNKTQGDDRLKEEKRVADEIEKINEDNFKLAEDNLKKFQAEQITLIENQNISREEKEKAFAQLELNVLNARRQNYLDYQKDIGDIDIQIANKHSEINKLKEKSDEEFEKQRRESLKAAIDTAFKQEEKSFDKEKELAEKKKQLMRDVFDLAQSLSQSLDSLLSAQFDDQVSRTNEIRDVQIKAIHDELEALETRHEKGKLADRSYEKQKADLLKKREANEKKFAEEDKKIKRKQAEIDKLLTVFRLTLLLAEAIASQNPFRIVAAAAGLALAVAEPIPAFAKGTKRKDKSGVGLVGEQGPEFVYMQKDAQVVPSPQTLKYREAINTMIDGQFEKYYIPTGKIQAMFRDYEKQMQEQTAKFMAKQLQQFNVTNTSSGVDEYGMLRALDNFRGDRFARVLGKVIKENLSGTNQRRQI